MIHTCLSEKQRGPSQCSQSGVFLVPISAPMAAALLTSFLDHFLGPLVEVGWGRVAVVAVGAVGAVGAEAEVVVAVVAEGPSGAFGPSSALLFSAPSAYAI
jgi:hypothetical protein